MKLLDRYIVGQFARIFLVCVLGVPFLFQVIDLTDNDKQVTVRYAGILPDLFREGKGIIANGKLDDRVNFIAQEVLSKHDEEYMPPELAGMHKEKDGQSEGSYQ